MWLYMLSGVGERRIERLLGVFGGARAVFEATSRELACVEGLGNNTIRNIIKEQNAAALEKHAEWLQKNGASFITREDIRYPALLRSINNPPYGLFVKGILPKDSHPKVAVVGSRRCTEYGKEAAYELSKEFASNGIVVVSGMASGIDSQAHRGALQRGSTIGVLGCGVDIVYPAENHRLASNICENGCIISTYTPGASPQPAYFPARNRIISGLCQAIVVVEAAKKSGTIITVGHALDQGREVFALPGSVRSKYSEGTNLLIKEGAAILTEADDVLNYLGINLKGRGATPNIDARPEESMPALGEESSILAYLNEAHIADLENILNKTGLEASCVNQALTMLELKGRIRKLPGLRFTIC